MADRSLSTRLTRKAGPFPVWLWAVLLLGGGYLVYRLRSGSSSSSTAAPTAGTSDVTAPTTDQSTSGTPGPDQTGTTDASVGLNDQLLSQLQGFQTSIDQLTEAVQSATAIPPGAGDSGSGSTVPNGQPTTPPAQQTTPAARAPTARTPSKPAKKPPPRPRPAPRAPVSGYSQRSRAHLH